jgi:predicted transcriptional regulator of viral defense system
MAKINYLAPTEQEIWSLINEKEYIDNELIRLVFPDKSPEYVRKILHSLWKKGYLKRVQRDFYVHPEQVDYWALALRLHEGYLGLSSALRLHNLIDYEDVSIYVMTKEDYNKINFGEHEIIYLPLGAAYTGFKQYGKYTASTPEKTIFDCLLKANLVGYGIITKAIYSSSSFDWDEFLAFFRMTDNKSLHQRTGYILELLESEAKMKIPKHVIPYLKSQRGNNVHLGEGKTVFNKDWNIQDGLGREKIIGWWH